MGTVEKEERVMNAYNVTMICKPVNAKHTYEVEAKDRNDAAKIMRRKFPKVWAIVSIKKVEEL
jgi:hypothetical protein